LLNVSDEQVSREFARYLNSEAYGKTYLTDFVKRGEYSRTLREVRWDKNSIDAVLKGAVRVRRRVTRVRAVRAEPISFCRRRFDNRAILGRLTIAGIGIVVAIDLFRFG